MIPKIIHYCWFGGKPLSKLSKQCIKTWRKYCPDYKIIEWNEKNFNINSAPLYVQQAYAAKMYAFVSDYVRLYALVSNGGIYLDTDMEVVKPLDVFLENQAFMGLEAPEQVQTSIMACEPNNTLFSSWLKKYDEMKFISDDHTYNTTSNVTMITNDIKITGVKFNGEFRFISGCAFYPVEYFSPKIYLTNEINATENTHAIHHYASSWIKDIKRREKIRSIKYIPNRILRSLLGTERYESLKDMIKK